MSARATLRTAACCTTYALLAALLLAPAGGQEPAKTDVPLKKVVMFSSGVAYFERAGEVEGNKSVELRFNTEDINDLLKSMVLQDEGGGRISTISYESKDPITRTLQTFAIDLTNDPTLADLLEQVRGEKVEIDAPTKIVGTIVGVEKREKAVGDKDTVEVAYLNLLTDDGLRSVALDTVGRIKLADEKLDAELRQALAVLATAKSKDKKTVTLNFTGAGKRPVRVGYIQGSPIWKTSYRLVLGEDKPLLQGWAIVENTTEDDWNEVNLTLISGRPISFVMNLYQPLYVERPVVEPELYASLRPRKYDQDLAAADAEFEQAERRKQMAEGKPAAEPAARAGASRRALSLADDARDGSMLFGQSFAKSVPSVAQAGDVGELFQYRVATPVSLARQKSAMLPIVNESVGGEKLSIYNQAVHAKHPLDGLRLKNTTDLHLMQGPITVFDGGAYAGDAQIPDVPAGSERLISYALDLDMEVAPTSTGEPQQLVSVKIVRGTLHVTRKHSRMHSYVVKNSGDAAKKVLIEYPIDQSWTLVAPEEPAEKTREVYRFAVTAEPGQPAELVIREERTDVQYVSLTNIDEGTIAMFLKAKEVSDPVKAALAEVVKRKAALAALTAKRTELERQVQVIFQEQERIRQNMEQLARDSDLYRRYVTKFNEQEDSLENLRNEIRTLQQQEAEARQSLDKFLQELDLS